MRKLLQRFRDWRARNLLRAEAIRILGHDEVAIMTADRLLALCETDTELIEECKKMRAIKDQDDNAKWASEYLFRGGR